jgi:hypothetical protein
MLETMRELPADKRRRKKTKLSTLNGKLPLFV